MQGTEPLQQEAETTKGFESKTNKSGYEGTNALAKKNRNGKALIFSNVAKQSKAKVAMERHRKA